MCHGLLLLFRESLGVDGRALGDLTKATLVMLALSSEHLQLLFKILQRLLDRLLTTIPFVLSVFQGAR